jgi:hypothetical protein
METAMTRLRPAFLKLALAGLLAAPLTATAAQPGGSGSAAQIEARLRSLETRVAALENGAGPAAPAAGGAAMAGPTCSRLAVVGAFIPPGGTLTVTVNGAVVATFDNTANGEISPFMRPGNNMIGLAFASAGGKDTEVELRCMPAGQNTRTVILRLKPTPQHLSTQAQVNLAGH